MRLLLSLILLSFLISNCKSEHNNIIYLKNISPPLSNKHKYSPYHFDSIKVILNRKFDSISLTFTEPFLQKEANNQTVFWVLDSLNLGKQDKRNYSTIKNCIIPDNKPIYGAIQNTIWDKELNSNLNRWIYWKYE